MDDKHLSVKNTDCEPAIISFPFSHLLHVPLFTRDLEWLKMYLRLVQRAFCPKGAKQDEGLPFLPVLITERQGACWQMNRLIR